MNSWKGYNIYTTNNATWVELMNTSTLELGIGSFPPHVFALLGTANDSDRFPDGAFIIDNASRTDFGTDKIEQVIFASTAAIVIIAVAGWLWKNIKDKTLLKPSGLESTISGELPRPNSPQSSLTLSTNEMSGREFARQLNRFYDEAVDTELEMYEKKIREEGVDVDDIERAGDMIREIYELNLNLYGLQSATNVADGHKLLLRQKRDELITEATAVLTSWVEGAKEIGWTGDEFQELQKTFRVLQDIKK
ncbi:hypothetical protein GQ53DRAFT_775238 [Thozetella sp. PMI_491]|nr:hypothetical protein GQ53DRAFT_775238 [Thozetella sp. PMI_491]